ncbi:MULTISPECIES: phytase [unclassified Streptomyces]|uniref:phytase n=1 Tax=unclassified Streptomyces TaxID=2593676 RepID=UPI00202DBD9E|nr:MULTISPECIES: phytase [unclassified Streptomyces]MCM1965134.1 phytase [Streptomyces sp. G1]MCX5300830.1 phytase [Streptomyces sp. NBC_00193]
MSFTVSARRAVLPAAVLAALAVPAAPAQAASFSVTATVETAPVSHSGDAADDPAIWVHPTDPAKSVVVGTDKKGALEVYDMTGARIQRISGDYGNNVDLRGNIVVTADDEAAGGNGAMHIYRIDPVTRQLKRLKDVPTEVTAHGICLYTSPASGKLYAFPNSTSGRVEQWELAVSGDSVTATSVRLWDAGSAVEGCYADDTTGKLYLGEEDVGVWIYGAEPTAGTTRTKLDSTGSAGHITADTEGITAAGNRIYVSSQGSNDFTVYDRTTHAYLGRFAVSNGTAADDCEDTDGIDASAADLGPAFPQGVFICQDGSNGAPGTSGNQNFKFVPLQRITANFA